MDCGLWVVFIWRSPRSSRVSRDCEDGLPAFAGLGAGAAACGFAPDLAAEVGEAENWGVSTWVMVGVFIIGFLRVVSVAGLLLILKLESARGVCLGEQSRFGLQPMLDIVPGHRPLVHVHKIRPLCHFVHPRGKAPALPEFHDGRGTRSPVAGCLRLRMVVLFVRAMFVFHKAKLAPRAPIGHGVYTPIPLGQNP